MTDFSIPGALSKSFNKEKNHRAHYIFTEYERYRKRYFKDLHITINDTDYLFDGANPADSAKYIHQTPPHQVIKNPNVELTPDLIEKFKNFNPKTERIPRYRPENATSRFPDTRKYTLRMATSKKAANIARRVDKYPTYRPKGIKHKTQQYIYFSKNENSDSNFTEISDFSPIKGPNQNTIHQNTDDSFFEKDSHSKNELEDEMKTLQDQFRTPDQSGEITDRSQNILIFEEEENPENYSEPALQSSDNAILQDADKILNALEKENHSNNEEVYIQFPEIFEEEEEDDLFDSTQNLNQSNSSPFNFDSKHFTDDLDDRPSNCGNSPEGNSDFVMSISIPSFLKYCSTKYRSEISSIFSVPQSEYEAIRRLGFNWIYVRDIPQNTNLKSLSSSFHQTQLQILIDYDETLDLSFADGIIFNEKVTENHRSQFSNKVLISPVESDYADYFYDERPAYHLQNRDPVSFMKCIQEGGIEKQRKIMRFITTDGLSFNERSEVTAAAMLLMLPGMRVININDINILDRLYPLLDQSVIWNGVFEYVDYNTSNGNMCAWKYSRGNHHLLMAANFDVPLTTGNIICNDCPNAEPGEKIKFVDILTETKYLREVIEVRTKGLCVILYEYEAQIFEY